MGGVRRRRRVQSARPRRAALRALAARRPRAEPLRDRERPGQVRRVRRRGAGEPRGRRRRGAARESYLQDALGRIAAAPRARDVGIPRADEGRPSPWGAGAVRRARTAKGRRAWAGTVAFTISAYNSWGVVRPFLRSLTGANEHLASGARAAKRGGAGGATARRPRRSVAWVVADGEPLDGKHEDDDHSHKVAQIKREVKHMAATVAPRRVELYTSEDLDAATPFDLYELAFRYDAKAYSTAVKPWAFKLLFERGYAAALYFDPDVLFYGGLDEVNLLLHAKGFVLTPHATRWAATKGLGAFEMRGRGPAAGRRADILRGRIVRVRSRRRRGPALLCVLGGSGPNVRPPHRRRGPTPTTARGRPTARSCGRASTISGSWGSRAESPRRPRPDGKGAPPPRQRRIREDNDDAPGTRTPSTTSWIGGGSGSEERAPTTSREACTTTRPGPASSRRSIPQRRTRFWSIRATTSRTFAARTCLRRIAATPRPRRGYPGGVGRGDAAAATWIF